jgi:hypothetical protein
MALVARPFLWFYHAFGLDAIAATGRNAYLIIISRSLRMLCFGTSNLILGTFVEAWPRLDFGDVAVKTVCEEGLTPVL